MSWLRCVRRKAVAVCSSLSLQLLVCCLLIAVSMDYGALPQLEVAVEFPPFGYTEVHVSRRTAAGAAAAWSLELYSQAQVQGLVSSLLSNGVDIVPGYETPAYASGGAGAVTVFAVPRGRESAVSASAQPIVKATASFRYVVSDAALRIHFV